MSRSSKRGFTLIELLVVIAIIAILAAILFPVFARAREQAMLRQCASNARQMGVAIYTYIGDYDGKYPMNRFRPPHPNTGFNAYVPSPYNWKHAIAAYVRSRDVQLCPNNRNAWGTEWDSVPGDEGNQFTGNPGDDPKNHPEWFPNSYSYNGVWFHESSYHYKLTHGAGPEQQPLSSSVLRLPANLIMVLESRIGAPDCGDWVMQWNCGDVIIGGVHNWSSCFQVHSGGRMNWIFADCHSKTLKFSQTIFPNQMWTDFPNYEDKPSAQDFLANEYNTSAIGELRQN